MSKHNFFFYQLERKMTLENRVTSLLKKTKKLMMIIFKEILLKNEKQKNKYNKKK